MPHPPVPAIEALGFNQKMVMVGHLAPGMTNPVKARAHLPHHIQPEKAVSIGKINILPPVPSAGHMIEATGKLKSQWTRHVRSVPV
jgi:hypothetical protein